MIFSYRCLLCRVAFCVGMFLYSAYFVGNILLVALCLFSLLVSMKTLHLLQVHNIIFFSYYSSSYVVASIEVFGGHEKVPYLTNLIYYTNFQQFELLSDLESTRVKMTTVGPGVLESIRRSCMMILDKCTTLFSTFCSKL